jgi:hypothetical protein
MTTLPSAHRDAWQRGKLDVECADCGRREAAGVKCSGCYHVHALSEYLTHADPRALHYRATGPVRTAGQPAEPPIKAVALPQATYDASPSLWEAAS